MQHFPDLVDTSAVSLSSEYLHLAEALAHNDHCRWGNALLKLGWQYGPQFDPVRQTHPHLVPFETLPEEAKSTKLKLFLDNFKVVLALGYRLEKDHQPPLGRSLPDDHQPCSTRPTLAATHG
ncbi:MAG: Ryanodine receptor Ryr [Leptolyngbyaceae cyanobacterium SM2_5_2]|nr:Ryanodine receptor Ryr [Leptolyngbyaceae cyanobacterium SM2_5_2]